MHDFDSAFDSLNLSTVPSDVRIEHLPQEGQHIEEMLRQAVQTNGFPDVPHDLRASAGDTSDDFLRRIAQHVLSRQSFVLQ